MLSFELSDTTGGHISLTRKERGWRKNVPAYITIKPGVTYTWNVHLNVNDWDGVSKLEKGSSYIMQAHLAIKADDKTDELNIWSGKVMSPDIRITYQDVNHG